MKKYRIDKNKNIGNVIFVVEGGRLESGGTELRLLRSVFSEVLGYEVQELRRGSDEFIGYGSNPAFRVFALNLPKNQLTQLNDETLVALFARVDEEFKVNHSNCPIFYLYDRDFKSYGRNQLRKNYVKKYTDPYVDAEGNQGQLLLSYPAVESYLLSCIQNDVYRQSCLLGTDVKPELANTGFSEEKIDSEQHLLHAAIEMDKGLASFGLEAYDLDNLSLTLLGVYDAQQEKQKTTGTFSILSLISMALLELGLIVEETDEEQEANVQNEQGKNNAT